MTNQIHINQIIQEHPFLKGLDAGDYRRLSAIASPIRFGAQQQIFQEGADADRFYLIQSGRVALQTFVPARGAVTLQTIGPGEALGWSWLFPPYRWHFTARATEETDALVFEARHLREMTGEDCRFGYELAIRGGEIMLQRLQATRMQLLDFYGDR